MPAILKTALLLFVASLFLTACIGSGSVNIPKDHYYRLPPSTTTNTFPSPLLKGSLGIYSLRTHGMLHERAILFVREQQPLEINPYHYHHWVNSPASMIQVHMLDNFRKQNIAQKHRRYRSDTPTDYIVRPELLHFERYIKSSTVEVHVGIELSVYATSHEKEFFRKSYFQKLSADNKNMSATISAFGRALDKIYNEFSHDLAAVNTPSRP